MLGHRLQGGVGGPGPPLGAGEVGGGEDPVHPELEEWPGLGHCPGQRLGVGAGQLPGVGPGREAGHGHLDLVAPLPLVDPGDGRLAGVVGVVGQHDALGEVAQQREVLLGQGRPAGGHGPGHPGHEEPDDVGVALADHHLAGGDDVVPWPS